MKINNACALGERLDFVAIGEKRLWMKTLACFSVLQVLTSNKKVAKFTSLKCHLLRQNVENKIKNTCRVTTREPELFGRKINMPSVRIYFLEIKRQKCIMNTIVENLRKYVSALFYDSENDIGSRPANIIMRFIYLNIYWTWVCFKFVSW